MATKKQSAASRRNSRKSTGPKSDEGKAKSSMNALRHGLRAQKVVLPDEEQADFDQLHAEIQDQYQPQNQSEQELVNLAAIAKWKLVRAEGVEADCYAEAKSAKERAAVLDRMTQITCRLERAYLKDYDKLERIKNARQKPPQQPQEQPSKPKKAKDDDEPANLDVFWSDPVTGEREYLYRRRDGKDLPTDESP
jgi:hypothetical protein